MDFTQFLTHFDAELIKNPNYMASGAEVTAFLTAAKKAKGVRHDVWRQAMTVFPKVCSLPLIETLALLHECRPYQPQRMSDMMRDAQRPQWLIPDLLFERQIGVAYGPPQSLKSFLLHDIGSRLVHGMDWHDKPLKRCRVLYLAGEGYPMFSHRRLAWFKHHNIPIYDTSGAVIDDAFEVVNGSFDMTDPEMVDDFIANHMPFCDDLELIVFDTLSTFTAGKDECESATMTLVIQHAKLIARKLNCAIMFVHHPGKDLSRGSRGHSALLGNIDTEWKIERVDNALECMLTVTKQKDAINGKRFQFKACNVVFDQDAAGEDVSSLVLDPCGKSDMETPKEDRLVIAEFMDFDMTVSIGKLADQLSAFGKNRTARKRIEAAIPPNEWARTERRGEVIEIHRTYRGNGLPGEIAIRSIHED